MTKQVFGLVHQGARLRAVEAVRTAPEGWTVTVGPSTRTLEQNAAQWPYLDALSKQSQWPVNGELVYMSDEEWKDVLTAAFKGDKVRLAKGLNGGVVMLGLRTRKFLKDEFSEWLEFLKWVCADRGVVVYPEEVAA